MAANKTKQLRAYTQTHTHNIHPYWLNRSKVNSQYNKFIFNGLACVKSHILSELFGLQGLYR